MKVVIVGGVAGGATAAARIRRLDEQAEIVVFERSGFISYANCGLPYYIGGVIEDPEDLTLQTPESFFSRFRIHMKVHHEVTAIHPEQKTVSVKNINTGEEFEEKYENSDIDEQLDIFARTMIINKYIGLDDIQYLVEEFKCPVNYKSKQEKILQDIDTIKMSSKLTALENHYDYMDSLVYNLKDNIEKVFGIPVSASIVIDGYEYYFIYKGVCQMKFICEREKLLKAINSVVKGVATKTTMPILEGILIQTNDNEIKFTTYDLEIGIEYIIEADVKEQGATVVNAIMFSEIIRRLPDTDIHISINDKNLLVIECEGSLYKLATMNPDEFPELPELKEDTNSLTINAQSLLDAINKKLHIGIVFYRERMSGEIVYKI